MPRRAPDTPTVHARRPRRARTIAAYGLAAPFPILALASLFAPLCWPCALLANFALPLALFAIAAAALSAALSRVGPTITALFAALLLASHLVPVHRAPPGDETDVRVLVFNVYAEARDHQQTIELLRNVDADLLLLNECSFQVAQAIRADEKLTTRFPHRELPIHDKQWARGVLSVWPLERLEKRDERWRELRFEYLYRRAQLVHHPETPFIATVTVFESPRTAARWRAGNETMRRDIDLLHNYVLSRQQPTIIGIDLNATPAAHRSRAFTDRTGLRRAKPIAVPAGTWPRSLPPILRAPIDDLFVTEDVRITSWQTIESPTNSDHAPILVGIDLPEPTDTATSQDP